MRELIGLGDKGGKVGGSGGKNGSMAGEKLALRTNLVCNDLSKKKMQLTSQQSDKFEESSSKVERRAEGWIADFTLCIASVPSSNIFLADT